MGIEVFRDCYGRVAQICCHQLIVCAQSANVTRIAVSECMKCDSSEAMLF